MIGFFLWVMSKLCIGFLDGKWFKVGSNFSFGNGDILIRFVPSIGLGLLNLTNNVHAFNYLAENNVSAVQPGSFLNGDEKLGSIGIFASVGHGQPSSSIMLELEVFVSEFFTINGSATSTYNKTPL